MKQIPSVADKTKPKGQKYEQGVCALPLTSFGLHNRGLSRRSTVQTSTPPANIVRYDPIMCQIPDLERK